jgi:hypothetical protein
LVPQNPVWSQGKTTKRLRDEFSEIQKFRLPADPNHFYTLNVPSLQRGVGHVIDVGRDAVDAVGAFDDGADAYGQVVSF